MKIISGGQTGVDRAALDVALEAGIPYGGWCPRGGWAEDAPCPPGVLTRYPLLRETPLADPAQRTEWNVRDAEATLILVMGGAVSKGTALAEGLARRYGKPSLMLDLGEAGAIEHAIAWLRSDHVCRSGSELVLGIGGPRESEMPGIYRAARSFLATVLPQIQGAGQGGQGAAPAPNGRE